jgi:hypothetical protein
VRERVRARERGREREKERESARARTQEREREKERERERSRERERERGLVSCSGLIEGTSNEQGHCVNRANDERRLGTQRAPVVRAHERSLTREGEKESGRG